MKYRTLNYIAHDGKRYARNETVEIPENNAEPLVKLGYLTPLAGVQITSEADTITGDGSGASAPPFSGKPKTAGGEPPEAPPALAIAELFAAAEIPKDDKPTTKEAAKIVKAQADLITGHETGNAWDAKGLKIKADLRDAAWELYLAMPADEVAEGDNEDGE